MNDQVKAFAIGFWSMWLLLGMWNPEKVGKYGAEVAKSYYAEMAK